MARTPKRPLGFTDAALDELLQGARSPEELDEVFRTLKRAMTERILRAELTDHLGYPEGGDRPLGEGNARNGTTPKTVLTDAGALPLAIRLLYSTNAIESLHRILRQALKVRGHFPTDDAASKLLYLALRNATLRLAPPHHGMVAMQHITLLFGDRVPSAR